MSEETKAADLQTAVDETRAFWRAMAREAVKTSTAAIEASAKQLIGIAGILEGLYFHAITFADLRGQAQGTWQMLAYLAPLVFWVFSLIAAGLVFYPRVYELNINSSEAAKAMHEQIIPRKHLFLALSFTWLVVGALFLIVALGIYLYH